MAPSRLNVLLVEDEASSRKCLEREIVALGHRCASASDGLEAAKILDQQPFDLVLSDWRMPNLDGPALCKHLRTKESTDRYTHFIFMTAYGDREHLLEGLGLGADELLSKPLDLDELRLRLEAVERVVARQRRLRRDSEGSRELARIDPLTGVGNRRRMEEELEGVVGEVSRYGTHAALAIFDVDHFKRYNDEHGHIRGDRVLRGVAQAIRQSLRASDRVYRYGGEEFVVLLPGQRAGSALVAIERMRARIAASCGVTVSVGISELPSGADWQAWIGAADEALYQAKEQGRDRVVTRS